MRAAWKGWCFIQAMKDGWGVGQQRGEAELPDGGDDNTEQTAKTREQ